MNNSSRFRFFFVHGVAWCIALVLFWSGAEHLKNPFAFFTSIARYQLIPDRLAVIVATVLPVLQTVLGVMLILAIARRFMLLYATVLLTLFSVVQASAVFRGLEIGCGCFGAANDTPITMISVARITVFTFFAGLAFSMSPRDREAQVG